MKVFISWSGTLGGQVAEQLRQWLPRVIQSVDPYLSSEDTHKGSRWADVVGKELETSNYGIICVTPESISSQWVNFEAGALSKELVGSHVSPFLIQVTPADLRSSPLSQFQSTVYHDFPDVFKLIKSINAASDRKLESEHLEEVFRTWWPKLRDPISKLVSDHTRQKPLTPGRTTNERLDELVTIARGHEKILNDLSKASKTKPKETAPIVLDGIHSGNIQYLLSQALSAADEVARSGNPESRALVRVRGLLGVIEKELFGKK